jgi:hypothetical protein
MLPTYLLFLALRRHVFVFSEASCVVVPVGSTTLSVRDEAVWAVEECELSLGIREFAELLRRASHICSLEEEEICLHVTRK